MQFSFALIALVAAGVVNAQFPQIPTCAESCLLGPLTTDGCSSLTDFACHCQKAGLVSKVTPCLQKGCTPAEQSAVASVVASQCAAAGYPITIPSNSNAGAATSSATLPASSVVPPVTTAVPSSTPVYYPVPSSTASTPVGTGISSSTAATATYSHFTGAASNVRGNMAGVAAIAAAAAYLL